MSSQPPLLDLVIDALEEMKAKNITSLDVRAVTSVADDMVIRARSRLRRDPSPPSLRTKTEVLFAMVTSRAQRLTLPA